jgi:CubicO group peptidase (beta-lactamase class C family)
LSGNFILDGSAYIYHVKLKSLAIFTLAPLLVALLSGTCTGVNKSERSDQDTLMVKVKAYLDREGENGFDGVVLVKIPGNEPMICSYGYANEEQKILNSSQTAFDIGSVTKQFTGAAIMKLQMDGRLNVHDSIGGYLPGLAPDKASITFHQLLTHTSGLPTDIGSDSEVMTKEVLLTRINQAPLICAPGTEYHYSHVGYNLLGLLIEAISGEDYESYLQSHLFRPARMKYTGYRAPDWNSTSIAHGYRYCNDWGSPMDAGWLEDGPSWNRRASGGMLSTVNDLYAWHLALLGNDILDKQAKNEYYYPEPRVEVNIIQSSGYGWRVIRTTRNTNAIAHNGWNGRFYSDFLRYLDEKVTIILLSNKFREGNQTIPYEIAKCIFWKDYVPKLSGSLTQCMDSLPDNRLGFLAGKVLTLLANGSEKDFHEFTGKYLASHLIKKYSEPTLINKLIDLQKTTGPLRIRQVMITDNQFMNIEVFQQNNNNEAFLRLFFDKDEDYRIRGFRFTSPDERR